MSRSTRVLALVLFGCSGLSGLLYEVVWTRMLTLHFGATAPSLAAVLSAYMAGLALGSAGAARWAPQVKRPLLAYGLLEIGVAIAAAALPLLLGASDPLLQAAYGDAGPGVAFQILRFAVAFASLLPPTLLMGATFPVLSQALVADPERTAADAGLAYAVNTLGAMAGAGLSGFVLIRTAGMSASLAAAVGVNLAVGALASLLWWRGRREGAAPAAPPPLAQAAAPSRTPWAPILLAGSSGLLSLTYEVLWTRFFINTFRSTTFAFTSILIAYLGGLGLGALIASRVARRGGELSLRHLGVLQALVALCVLFLVPTLEQLPKWFGAVYALTRSDLATHAVLITAVMLLPTVLLGMILPLCVHVARGRERWVARNVGKLYAASSVGSAVGPPIAAFVLLPALGVSRALLLVAGAQAVLALALSPWRLPGRAAVVRLAPTAAAAFAVVLALALGLGRDPARGRLLPRYEPFLGSEGKVLAYHEGAHGTAMVSEEPGGRRSLFLDGFLSTSNLANTEYMAMMAHLPLLARPGAKRVLVICLGTGMTAGSAALHDIERLDIVELNPDVEACTRYFDAENHRLLEDPRVRVVIDDGRNYLHRSRRSYDVITLEPLPPWFAGTVSLYTREFNALARQRLVAGGVLAQWLPYHLVSDYKSRMIVAAMREVFPYVGVWVDPMNYSGIVLASDQPFALDLALAPPKAAADLQRLRYVPQEVLDDYWALPPDFARTYVAGVPPVTDDHPYLEYPDAKDDEPAKDAEERFDRRVAALFKAGGKDVNQVLRRTAARLRMAGSSAP